MLHLLAPAVTLPILNPRFRAENASYVTFRYEMLRYILANQKTYFD
jgi:hypothetical protein